MKTLYTNGTVVTMSPFMPQAEALVTDGCRILGVGSRSAMAELAGSNSTTVDMQGGALFPGFNETHTHLSLYAIYRQHAYLGACETIADLQLALKAHNVANDAPVITGYSYDDTMLADGHQITCHDLDMVSRDKPVAVIHISGHIGFLNSKAMELFGITHKTPVPEGSAIHRAEDGSLNGRLDEMSWFEVVSRLGSPDPTTYQRLLDESVKEFNSQGITAVHDAGLGIEGMPETVLASYGKLAEQNRLGLRIFISAIPDIFDAMQPAPLQEMGDTRIHLGGVKLFLDGSIQAETAALLTPYHRHDSWKGEMVMGIEEFEQQICKYHAAGHHISIHGNGDAAIEAIVTAMEKAQKISPQPGNRHMLIHSQMAHDNHLQRMRAVGLIPSFFCMHVHNWGNRHKDIFIGPERAARIDPAGKAESLGLPFTLHVDTPVLPIQVLGSIQAAVTRETRKGDVLGPEHCTSPYSAVAAYTSMAALCSRSEKHRGTLAPGKLADMTLLSADITAIEPTTIKNTNVLRTIVGGEPVYVR